MTAKMILLLVALAATAGLWGPYKTNAAIGGVEVTTHGPLEYMTVTRYPSDILKPNYAYDQTQMAITMAATLGAWLPFFIMAKGSSRSKGKSSSS